MDPANLVTPYDPRPGERAYWERAEALAREYAAGLPQPVAEETLDVLSSFCSWPPCCAETGAEGWRDWAWRFDSDMMAKLDGRELVFIGLGGAEDGWDPDAMVDALRDFVRWLGALGHVDSEQAERVCDEIESARETWVLAVAQDRDDPWIEVAGPEGCPCCAADAAVAPFVAWLRDTMSFSLDRRLLGQALAICALEQLRLHAFVDGAFVGLEIGPCLDHAYARTEMVEPDRRELCAVARALATFLAHRCGLSGTHKRRIQSEAERWAA